MAQEITLTVNGATHTNQVEPRLLLADYLRSVLDLTGTHVGCDTSNCGACTVSLNGDAVKSCTVFAVQADGADVTTLEGLASDDGTLHPIQEGFWEKHGLQCGFCTPGFLVAAKALLERNSDPTEIEVRYWLAGNLCRYTGYDKIVRAVMDVAAETRGK